MQNLSAVRPTEVAWAALVGAYCVVGNALATAYVEPLSTDNLGPFALAYHRSDPPLVILPLLLLLLLVCPVLPAAGRAGVVAFVGAAYANIGSAALWRTGVPDYIVFRNIDVITNVADLVMVGSAVVVIASILARLGKRLTGAPRVTG